MVLMLPVPMVLIHAHWEVRTGLRQLMQATGTGQIVLELDGVERARLVSHVAPVAYLAAVGMPLR
jgi:DNA-binding NarL/FixJ family response regulator